MKFIEGPCVIDPPFTCQAHGSCVNGVCSCEPGWTNFNGFGYRRGQVCVEHVLALQVLVALALTFSLLAVLHGFYKLTSSWSMTPPLTGANVCFSVASGCKLASIQTARYRAIVCVAMAT
eukprot:g59474.t1